MDKGNSGDYYAPPAPKQLAVAPDGTLKWRYETGNWVISVPAIGADGTIYVGSNDMDLYAIGKGTGTGISDKGRLPQNFSLNHNYPNPFNPSTKIRFSLPQSEQVKVNVYNTIGQKIET